MKAYFVCQMSEHAQNRLRKFVRWYFEDEAIAENVMDSKVRDIMTESARKAFEEGGRIFYGMDCGEFFGAEDFGVFDSVEELNEAIEYQGGFVGVFYL